MIVKHTNNRTPLSLLGVDSYEDLQKIDWSSLSASDLTKSRLTSAQDIALFLNNVYIPEDPKFKVAVNPYLLSLMDKDDVNCPIRLQYLPSHHEEQQMDFTLLDELGEEHDTIPGTSIVHRYPQRVLFLVSNQCQAYCRFCTRKRMVGVPSEMVHMNEIEASINYIANNTSIQDVLLSGGDPLMFRDEKLDYILSQIRKRAPHVMFLRIGSRMVVQNPLRITKDLCDVLERNDVNMLNIHINHPKEITPLLKEKCRLLSKSVMLGCQTVCLKGINDKVEILRDLFMKCLSMKVRPYYVYSTDMVEGAHQFIVSYKRMLELYEGLRGWISGPAIPTFVVDGLGGLGKMPIIPTYVTQEDGTVKCRNFENKTVEMPALYEPV